MVRREGGHDGWRGVKKEKREENYLIHLNLSWEGERGEGEIGTFFKSVWGARRRQRGEGGGEKGGKRLRKASDFNFFLSRQGEGGGGKRKKKGAFLLGPVAQEKRRRLR